MIETRDVDDDLTPVGRYLASHNHAVVEKSLDRSGIDRSLLGMI
jgi:hypothetical protein